MKAAIDTSPPRSFSKLPKPYQLIPYNRRYQIMVDNKQMINKILSIAQKDGSQKGNTVSKPNKGRGINEWQRAQDNKNLGDRLMKAKPAIGSV